MSFLSATFLFGMVAAGGPVLIHLLNRRRYRTIQWAAMDFLREAMKRNRRVVEIRDLLLMLLRTLAIALFILAMARPFFVSSDVRASAREPVHAVLVIDNSLSMGYAQLNRTLLDQARDRAREYIASLPEGSHISVVPMAALDDWHTRDVYTTPEDAYEALEEIEIVDRAAYAQDGADQARRAVQQASPIPSKRVVFLTDLQSSAWGQTQLASSFENLTDVQVVTLIDEPRNNSWIDSFALRDGIADASAETVFLVTVRHEGDGPRTGVRVNLLLDGQVVDADTVDLYPGQELLLRFKHTFDVAGTSRQPRFVEARVQLPPDFLEADDHRSLIVPVVSRLPVLFVDDLGERENPRGNLYGQTFPLRRLLAPRRSSDDVQDNQLVHIVHRSVEAVTREDMAEARLIVIAGVEAPTQTFVNWLSEYVQQGGQVLMAAGGAFDPAQWTAMAWNDATGPLPAPLEPVAIGATPVEQPTVNAFHLDPATTTDAMFHMGLTGSEREDLLLLPSFFKAVAIDEPALEGVREQLRTRLAERDAWIDDYLQLEQQWAAAEQRGSLSAAEAERRDQARQAYAALQPTWLEWSSPAGDPDVAMALDQRVERAMPAVLARYDSGRPFAVRRRIGKGSVVMLTSGVFPGWNNIATDHGVLLLDQAARQALAASLPRRTLESPGELVIPVDASDAGADFLVYRPGETEATTFVPKALDEYTWGFVLRDVTQRGVYRVERTVSEGEADDNAWSLALAVNGPPNESELTSVDATRFTELLGDADVRLVNVGQPIRLEGTSVLGYDFWRWLMLAALAMLAAEMLFVMWPRLTGREGKA